MPATQGDDFQHSHSSRHQRQSDPQAATKLPGLIASSLAGFRSGKSGTKASSKRNGDHLAASGGQCSSAAMTLCHLRSVRARSACRSPFTNLDDGGPAGRLLSRVCIKSRYGERGACLPGKPPLAFTYCSQILALLFRQAGPLEQHSIACSSVGNVPHMLGRSHAPPSRQNTMYLVPLGAKAKNEAFSASI